MSTEQQNPRRPRWLSRMVRRIDHTLEIAFGIGMPVMLMAGLVLFFYSVMRALNK